MIMVIVYKYQHVILVRPRNKTMISFEGFSGILFPVYKKF